MTDVMRRVATPIATESARVHVSRYGLTGPINTHSSGDENKVAAHNHGFALLPNPTITLYIYPHLSTRHRAPVPGYKTAIKLYARDEYAVPGEYQAVTGEPHVQP